MGLQILTLTEKIQLTGDVFELVFCSQGQKQAPVEGQFITFLLPKSGGRAYSILDYTDEKYHFIIKRLENGRGGSKEICDSEIGVQIKAIGPAGHFILKKTDKNKLFLGTGTGFVPLYYQILGTLRSGLDCKLHLIFGVREQKDVFYIEQLDRLVQQYSNFSYKIYLSQEQTESFGFGRITQKIEKNMTDNFEEFYICGNPAMVEDMEKILQNFGTNNIQIFTEKY